MEIGVCWKWVPGTDGIAGGVSPADESALEVALAVADAHGGTSVVVVSCGPAEGEAGLRRALAAGAGRAVRVDADRRASSVDVAAALAGVVADCDVALCGEHSLDRGSGSVPAYLAALLRRPQALGLIEVDTTDPGTWRASRRLDGGRRELLTIRPPAVLSVEAPAATLRRASLAATRAAATAPIEVRPGPHQPAPEAAARVTPFSPRTHVVRPPSGDTALDRIRSLTERADTTPSSEPIAADPGEAAALILAALRDWGYLAAEV